MALLDDRSTALANAINSLSENSPELWELIYTLAFTRLANASVGAGGGGGTGITEFAEDTQHVNGALGNLGLVVRRDANTSLVDADGDYAPLQVDPLGNLKVNVVAGGTTGGATETTLNSLNTKVPAQGQAAMASSLPVVIASNQSQVPQNLTQIAGTAVAVNAGAVSAGTQRVVIASDQTPVQVTSQSYKSSVTLTRPANVTPYTAGDVVGGVLTFPNIGATGQMLLLTSFLMTLNISAIPSGMHFSLYLYDVTPPSAFADNAAWDLPTGDRASFLGSIGIGTPFDLGSTCSVEINSIGKQLKLAGTSLFAYLVTNAAFTPAANSEVYNLTLFSVGT